MMKGGKTIMFDTLTRIYKKQRTKLIWRMQ